jgi:DNA-binding PadR family transcriptional regulator
VAEKHTVLALMVGGGPACSAELTTWLFEQVGIVGPTSAMVDRSLIELCADGFVEGTGELRDPRFGSRRDRVVYAVTPEGYEEFERWRDSPIDVSQLRAGDPLSWFPRSYSGCEQITALIAEAGRRERRCRERLAGYTPVPDERVDDLGRPIHDVLRDLVFNHELELLENEAETLARLQDLLRRQLDQLDGGRQ